MKNPANTMWPLRFTYRGAVVHITHKASPLVTWGASVMSVNIIPMHLRIEIDRQVREAEKAAEKIAALAAERAAQAERLAVDSPRHVQQNRESGMKNSSIMALALALRNVGAGQAVKVPAMTGDQFRQLLAWLEVLR